MTIPFVTLTGVLLIGNRPQRPADRTYRPWCALEASPYPALLTRAITYLGVIMLVIIARILLHLKRSAGSTDSTGEEDRFHRMIAAPESTAPLMCL